MSSKQLTQRRNFLTPDNQTAFLSALADRKLNVTAACRAAGLASTSGVYEQRKIDPEFALRWQEIEEEILDTLEEKQMEAAERDNEDRRWVLSRRRAQRWSERNAHLSVKAEVEHRVSVKELSRLQGLAGVRRHRAEESVVLDVSSLLDGHYRTVVDWDSLTEPAGS